MEQLKAPNVARSAGRFTLALVVQRLLAFGYFSYAAVAVGPAGLGSFTVAVNLAMAAGALADLGLANVLTREVARQPSRLAPLYATALIAKVCLAGAAFLILQLLGIVASDSGEVRALLWGAGIAMVLDGITLLNYAVARAQDKLQREGWGSIATQLAIAAVGIPLLLVNPTATSLVVALLAGSVLNLAYSSWIIAGPALRVAVAMPRGELRHLSTIAWPFALSLVLTRVYGYADTVIIARLDNIVAAGLYSLPVKLLTALQFVPLAFVAALYPALSWAFGQRNRGAMKSLFQEGMRILWLLGCGAAAALIAGAEPLVRGLYGIDYAPSIPVIIILMLQVPLLFISFPLGALLNACDRQRRTTAAMGAALIADVVLLLALYPAWGIIGAAVASTASTFVLVAIQWRGAASLPVWGDPLGRSVIMGTLCALIATVVGLVVNNFGPWPVSIMLTLGVFLVLAAASGVLTKHDIQKLVGIIKRT